MKIITQLVILTLSLLLVNADQYCDNLLKVFKHKCIIKSCCEVKFISSDYGPSGVYRMSRGAFGSNTNVYCDLDTNGGGWIVIQRNKRESSVNFNRYWADYEKGFGDLNAEFWYGLEEIHYLTQRGQWEMRVDYQFNNKTWSYLHYNQFSIGSSSEEYQLTVGGFTGVGTDRFTYHNGMKFSTPDNDGNNCAAQWKSGWWFNNCRYVNINQQPPHVYNSVLFSEMKIRPKDCITQ